MHKTVLYLTKSQIGTGMPRGDLQLQIYQTALLFAVLKECRALADSIRTDRAMMADLHIRLEETFNLTQEQRVHFLLSFHTDSQLPRRQTSAWSLGSCSWTLTVSGMSG